MATSADTRSWCCETMVGNPHAKDCAFRPNPFGVPDYAQQIIRLYWRDQMALNENYRHWLAYYQPGQVVIRHDQIWPPDRTFTQLPPDRETDITFENETRLHK